MKQIDYTPSGVCSRLIHVEMNDEGKIENVAFIGGCHGNLQGISRLVQGMTSDEVRERLAGIKCGMKQTSCPDQLCKAISALEKH